MTFCSTWKHLLMISHWAHFSTSNARNAVQWCFPQSNSVPILFSHFGWGRPAPKSSTRFPPTVRILSSRIRPVPFFDPKKIITHAWISGLLNVAEKILNYACLHIFKSKTKNRHEITEGDICLHFFLKKGPWTSYIYKVI